MIEKREDRGLDDSELERLFEAARDDAPAPSAALFARIMADADAVLDDRAVAPVPAGAPRPGVLARCLAAVGGWQTATGLAAATVAGLGIGLAAPDALDTLSGGYLSAGGYEASDLAPSYVALLGDG